jgi:SAM-dependent methyltransferase
MGKLTRVQIKDRDRVLAWLKDQPFRESSREKPAVPVLTPLDVFDQYIEDPYSMSQYGAFYTPQETANDLIERAFNTLPELYDSDSPVNIIDPCAGIGSLLFAWTQRFAPETVTAIELSYESAAVGQKALPAYGWRNEDAFGKLWDEDVARYDLVIMNPPFGNGNIIPCDDGVSKSKWGAKKAHHLFLELAARLLIPDGILLVIGPYNLFESLPKSMADFTGKMFSEFHTLGQLDGEFKETGIRVHGYALIRSNEPARGTLDDVLSVKPAPLLKVEQPPKVEQPQAKKPVTASTKTVVVPQAVYDALLSVSPADYPANISFLVKSLKLRDQKEAAAWIDANRIEYGRGYWNGFVTENSHEAILLSG